MSSQRSSPDSSRLSTRPSKRHLPKTKTGCKTCKRRKIKCDEERPSCRNCLKHNVGCDFLESRTPSLSCTPTANGPGDLNTLDLELLLNYTTATYSTFSNDRLSQDFWRHAVPTMGLQCDYVMRSVLALSALHLAFYRPARREFYVSTALQYHQLASRKAMALLDHVTRESAESLFIFSILTICVALGSPRKADGTLLVGESSCPEWMGLLKGTKSIVAVMPETVKTGSLAFLFRWREARVNAARESVTSDAPRLREKLDAFERLQRLMDMTVADEAELRTYTTAIALLRDSSHVLEGSRGHANFSDAFIWVWQVADDFLPLLQVPRQGAVAVLAHFSVHLKELESLWWFRGWADHLISRAWELLDEAHRPWIRWPIEAIGWVAP